MYSTKQLLKHKFVVLVVIIALVVGLIVGWVLGYRSGTNSCNDSGVVGACCQQNQTPGQVCPG